MDDDKKKPGTRVPLITDMVFGESLPLKPPSRRSSGKSRYAPDYDPDTIDLFGDHPDGIDKAVTEELRQNVDSMIDNLVSEYAAKIEQRLRQELTSQLVGILGHLDHQENSEKY